MSAWMELSEGSLEGWRSFLQMVMRNPEGWKKTSGVEHATGQRQRTSVETVVENMGIPFSISESSGLVASSQLVDQYSECSPYERNKI